MASYQKRALIAIVVGNNAELRAQAFIVAIVVYEGHWKGWALEIETFLGPEMATSKASAIWAQKSPPPFTLPQRYVK